VTPSLAGELVIGRLGRIGPTYSYAISSAILLVRELKRRGRSARLVVVGHVEDRQVYEDLCRQAGDDATFLVDASTTFNAHKLLPTFHAVVATGRGAHEALARGVPTFCASRADRLPVFVNASTIAAVSKENFSNRFSAQGDLDHLMNDFVNVTSSDVARSQYSEWAKRYFYKFYSVEKTVDVLADLYASLSGYASVGQQIYARLWMATYLMAKLCVRILRGHRKC
jgi:hypothetical protein